MQETWYKTFREVKAKINHNIAAYRIYDYLADHALFVEREYKGMQLLRGQVMKSYSEIAEGTRFLENNKWQEFSRDKISRQLAWLVKMEVIKIEKTAAGTVFTVLAMAGEKGLATEKTEGLATVDEVPPTLEPQGFQPLLPEGLATEKGVLATGLATGLATAPALEPQGIDRQHAAGLATGLETPILNKNYSNKNYIQEENNIKKQQQKISQPVSIVNAFSTAFNFILQKFENELLTDRLEATKAQIDAIRIFVQSMDTELLVYLMQEAGEGTQKNPAAYFIKICRENMQKGINTLDKKLQSAAQYRQGENTGRQQQKKDTSTFATRRGLAVPDSYYDDLPF